MLNDAGYFNPDTTVTYAERRQPGPLAVGIADAVGVSVELVAVGAGIVYLVLKRIRLAVNMSAWKVPREAAFYFFEQKNRNL